MLSKWSVFKNVCILDETGVEEVESHLKRVRSKGWESLLLPTLEQWP